MLSIPTMTLLLYSIVAFLLPAYGSSQLHYSNYKNISCGPSETDCGYGCCPFPNAVCCADHFECCPEGTVCIAFVGICVGIEDNSLVSKKPTDLRKIVADCPPYTTECAKDKCCLLPDAVCCSDGEHCCPQGYTCDLEEQKCIKSSNNQIKANFPGKDVTLYGTSKKPTHKSCPGGTRQCPWYASCCLNNQGNWGCCPDPSSNLYRKANGECCDTMFGFICCPDVIPTCTYLGCH